MPAAYPSFLRPMLRTKTRSQAASFSIAEPRRGAGYVRKIGTDIPTFWDGTFRFTRDEALVFRLWFKYTLNEGADPFTLPILTEFGVVTQTCQFLPDSLIDTSESGEVVIYKATVMVRAEVIPDGYADAAALITGLPNWAAWAALLDQAISAEMPA